MQLAQRKEDRLGDEPSREASRGRLPGPVDHASRPSGGWLAQDRDARLWSERPRFRVVQTRVTGLASIVGHMYGSVKGTLGVHGNCFLCY
jgi:hypothetical protein